MKPVHPIENRPAAWYYGFLALYLAMGVVFHLISTVRHWRDR